MSHMAQQASRVEEFHRSVVCAKRVFADGMVQPAREAKSHAH